jgi:hypothetical protein
MLGLHTCLNTILTNRFEGPSQYSRYSQNQPQQSYQPTQYFPSYSSQNAQPTQNILQPAEQNQNGMSTYQQYNNLINSDQTIYSAQPVNFAQPVNSVQPVNILQPAFPFAAVTESTKKLVLNPTYPANYPPSYQTNPPVENNYLADNNYRTSNIA